MAVFVAGMFTIIGGDGKEYGPVAAGQVRAWLAAGRANLQTKAKARGSDEWRQLGDFPEFGGPGELPPLLPSAQAGTAIPAATTGTIDRASRTGAALINAGFYFVAMLPGSMMMSRQLLAQNPEIAKGAFPKLHELDLSGFQEAVGWVWAGLLSAMFLQCLLLGLRGQNIGKLAVGARIVRITDGEPAGFFRGAFLRFVVPVAIVMFLNILFPLGLIFLAIDYAFMFRADERCLHDLIAGTKVVRT